jgi:hypothetical protein
MGDIVQYDHSTRAGEDRWKNPGIKRHELRKQALSDVLLQQVWTAVVLQVKALPERQDGRGKRIFR